MTGKTWGPFTGAQLTMMVLGVTATLAVPGSLWAVAASSVSVTDIANGHTAAVSSARRLFVSSLEEGTPTPAAFFHASVIPVGAGTCRTLFAPPSGKAAIVIDVRINVYQNPSPGLGSDVLVYSGPNCSQAIGDLNPPTVGHYVIPFGPGLATQTGISVYGQGSLGAEAYVDGYLVPAAQVPAG